jgi:hypothetical protein
MSGHGIGSRHPGGGAITAAGRDGQQLSGSQQPKTKEGAGGVGALKKRSSTDKLKHKGSIAGPERTLPEGDVHLILLQARNLPKSDLIGKSDPYAVISCGSDSSKTPVSKDNLNPVWNHEAVFPIDPNTPATMDIRVLDSDRLGRDKPLGQLQIDIADLAENGPLVQQWLPLDKAKSGEVQVTAEFVPEGIDERDGGGLAGGRGPQVGGILKPEQSRGGEGGGAKHLKEKLAGDEKAHPKRGLEDDGEDGELVPGTLHLGK